MKEIIFACLVTPTIRPGIIRFKFPMSRTAKNPACGPP